MASPQPNKQVITPPPAQGPRYGLLFVAQQILSELKIFHAPKGPGLAEGQAAPDAADDDVRWTLGIKWSPEQVLGGGALAITCLGNTAESGDDLPDNPGLTTADPFVVWAAEKCSTLGWKGRDFEGRARRQLEGTQSFRVAHELWTGELAQAGDLDNEWLTHDPAILPGAAQTPHLALGLVEQALGAFLGGRRGMIHVSEQVLVELVRNGAVQLNGQLWLSPMGNFVVADAGYPGTGPDDAGSANQWIYGTPIVTYRLDEMLLIPGSFADARTMAQATNLEINSIELRAERAALLAWEWNIPVDDTGKHGVVAAETDLPAFTFGP